MPTKIKRSLFVILILFFSIAVHGAAGAAPQNSDASVMASGNVYSDATSLAAELRRIGTAIEEEKANPPGLAAVRKNLPSHWELNASEHRYYISAEPLTSLLREAEKGKKTKTITAKAEDAAQWAFDLASQVKAYGVSRNDADTNIKAALDRILNRREFGAVKGP